MFIAEGAASKINTAIKKASSGKFTGGSCRSGACETIVCHPEGNNEIACAIGGWPAIFDVDERNSALWSYHAICLPKVVSGSKILCGRSNTKSPVVGPDLKVICSSNNIQLLTNMIRIWFNIDDKSSFDPSSAMIFDPPSAIISASSMGNFSCSMAATYIMYLPNLVSAFGKNSPIIQQFCKAIKVVNNANLISWELALSEWSPQIKSKYIADNMPTINESGNLLVLSSHINEQLLQLKLVLSNITKTLEETRNFIGLTATSNMESNSNSSLSRKRTNECTNDSDYRANISPSIRNILHSPNVHFGDDDGGSVNVSVVPEANICCTNNVSSVITAASVLPAPSPKMWLSQVEGFSCAHETTLAQLMEEYYKRRIKKQNLTISGTWSAKMTSTALKSRAISSLNFALSLITGLTADHEISKFKNTASPSGLSDQLSTWSNELKQQCLRVQKLVLDELQVRHPVLRDASVKDTVSAIGARIANLKNIAKSSSSNDDIVPEM